MSAPGETRRRLLAVIAGGSIAVLVLALGYAAITYVRLREARAHWSEMSARLGEEGYDAAESDRRYVVVEGHAQSLDSTLEVAAGAAVLAIVAGWRRHREGMGARNSPGPP